MKELLKEHLKWWFLKYVDDGLLASLNNQSYIIKLYI